MYFEYGEKELIYLKQKDKRLAEVIDQVGMIERTVDDDLFSSVVHHIVGQQISTKAQATIWQRMKDYLHSLGVKVPIVTSNLLTGAADIYGHIKCRWGTSAAAWDIFPESGVYHRFCGKSKRRQF